MRRVDLVVPYAERREVRRLGACWDPAWRVWFVPEGRDPAPFGRWLPPPPPPNVRAADCFIATALMPCWRCRGTSKVHGFALPAGHETQFVDEETGEVTWEASEEPSFVCYLEHALPAAIAAMERATANYRFTMRHKTGTCYWANFCEFCNTKLGDFDVFCEPGQGFMPLTREEAGRITLVPTGLAFAASAGGWSLGVELFEFMQLTA